MDVNPMHSSNPTHPVDAVELEIFKHLFAAIAEEMGVRLMRSAYSPNIKERRDFSCALFDADGELIAQAAHIPVHLGAMPMSVQAVLQAFPPQKVSQDQCFVLNDPYCGGTHLPDITVGAPCLSAGETTPRFFVANRAHHADVGGQTAGSMALATSIEDEGLRIPPTLLDAGMIERIAKYSRTPEERRGDLQAQIAALNVGSERLSELCSKHGTETAVRRGAELRNYTERAIRRIITEIPDGNYGFTDYLDDDGCGTSNIAISCRLQIDGDTAVVDFSSSADQVAGPVNAVKAITASAVNYAFRCLAPSDLPSNGGVMRPIRLVTQPGSIVDAVEPAAVAAGNVETSQRIVDAALGALAQAIPGRVPAASCGSMSNVAIGGTNPDTGRAFAYYETVAGGLGGGPNRSGASAVHAHMTNTRNTPIEALEHGMPVLVETYAIRRGSGGAGKHKGGDGIKRRFLFKTPTEITLLAERRLRRPYGLEGGEPGGTGCDLLVLTDETQRQLPGKCAIVAQPGEKLEINSPGGGGWGNPGDSHVD